MRIFSEFTSWSARARMSGHTGAYRTPSNPPASVKLVPLTRPPEMHTCPHRSPAGVASPPTITRKEAWWERAIAWLLGRGEG